MSSSKMVEKVVDKSTADGGSQETSKPEAGGGRDRALRGEQSFKAGLVWPNIILFALLHSALPIGAQILWSRPPWLTLAWTILLAYMAMLGIVAGAHRLWSHRSYKAKLPVELLLMVLQTMAGQNSIYTWVRDHRLHHKYVETDADPHNIKRGLFFAHMGWLLCRKHPEIRAKGARIDLSDIEADSVVMFQHRHFWSLALVFHLLVPTLVPVLLWNESIWTSFVFSFAWRYILSLHGIWLVNSAAHYHGDRPYDETSEARESPLLIGVGVGPGFHNFHHAFPYDYSASEYGYYFNLSTAFIDLFALFGLVYDRRKVSAESVAYRKQRVANAKGCV